MEQVLHIVSLTIPWPPNYGGAIDIYYKIKALSEQGVKIHLHAFKYDRPEAYELKELCETVTYYERKRRITDLLSAKPFIIKTRINSQLIKNLQKDNHPILIEGIHCAGIINKLDARRVFIRAHNVEHDYYKALSKSALSLQKKLFYNLESFKLKKAEKLLSNVHQVFAISENDTDSILRHNKNTKYIPAFHQFNSINSKSGSGSYLLIHGNLSVEENISSTLFLLKHVIKYLDVKTIVAGKNPDPQILKAAESIANAEVVCNPSLTEMDQLIENAHIILLHTFQNTGIKLKLLNSVFSGRYCLANHLMIDNTGLVQCCQIANTPDEWIKNIIELYSRSFSSRDIEYRKNILSSKFSNEAGAKKIINYIFDN